MPPTPPAPNRRSRTHDRVVSRESDSRKTALRYLRLCKPKFTLLIGSGARKNQKRYNDIDIVRIGHIDSVKLDEHLNGNEHGPISYIDYDGRKFLKLYREGSLFLYHVFTEGDLLRGNKMHWGQLKKGFRVSTNFREEIAHNRKLLRWLQQGEKFRGASIPYLAHTFRALKNLAIFSLAQKRHYVFDKRAALQKAFPNLDRKAITLLIDANEILEHTGTKRQPHLPELYLDDLRRQVKQAVITPRTHAYR